MTEHGEKAADLLGKERLGGVLGKAGDASAIFGIAHDVAYGNYDEASKGTAEFVIGKIPVVSSYYYGYKLTSLILNSKFTVSQAYLNPQEERNNYYKMEINAQNSNDVVSADIYMNRAIRAEKTMSAIIANAQQQK